MYGIDTLQVVSEVPFGWAEIKSEKALAQGKGFGSHGHLWWREFRGSSDDRYVYKAASPHAGWLVWEGSVPKSLGIERPANGSDLREWVTHLGRDYGGMASGRFSRVDLCSDHVDPDRELLARARGWQPHARSRYVEAVFQNGETVFLFNKSRGIRIYDKERESGSAAYLDTVRIEYQLRRRWAERLGFRNGVDELWDDRVSDVLGELESDLLARSAEIR